MATTDLGKWMITNGGDYDPDATYEQLTMVMYDNSTYITLKTVTGVTPSNDQINYALMARGFDPGVLSSVTAVDTSGALGNAGETVSAQSLVDYLADAVMTKLVEKANISNVQVNDSSKVPSAALAYAMQQQITENEDAISVLNSDLNSRNDVSDLLAEADMGRLGKRIVMYGINTLNTPYKAGLTPETEGVAYINMTSDNYGTILITTSGGDDVFCRCKTDGTWSPEWSKFVTNNDFAAIQYNDTPGDTIQDMMHAKAKFINQNAYYAPGILPGGWQGHENGFTLFYKISNIIILVFIGQYDIHMANYTIESDTISNVLKVTTTEL